MDLYLLGLLALDENYMFTIEQKVKNNSNKYKISFLMEGLIEPVLQKHQVSISFMKDQLGY